MLSKFGSGGWYDAKKKMESKKFFVVVPVVAAV